jgi:hypothetical protein
MRFNKLSFNDSISSDNTNLIGDYAISESSQDYWKNVQMYVVNQEFRYMKLVQTILRYGFLQEALINTTIVKQENLTLKT